MSKKPLKLRMDKSKPYSTCHGERGPDDPHKGVAFYQDGMPFDGEGFLMLDAIPASDTKLREKAEKKLAKLNGGKLPANEPAAADTAKDDGDGDGEENTVSDADDDDDDDADQSATGEVNLESWLRGDLNYQWFAVAAAIRTRFAKNVQNQNDAVLFLVTDQNVVTPDQLAKKFQSALN